MTQRSIISLESLPDEGGRPGVVIGCDCGTTTHLVVDADGPIPDGYELAFTCGGCNSTHWAKLITAGIGPEPAGHGWLTR